MAQVGDLVVTGRATFVNGIRGEVNPLYTNTYTGLIGSSNDAAGASFYFGAIMPTGGYYDIWKIHFKITAVAAGNNNAKGYFDCWITGTQSSMITYHNYNTVVNTSYRTIYYTNLYRATSDGISAGYGHLLGIGMSSAWNPTTAANARTVKIEILETINCTYTPWDTALKYASVPGTGSTNYSGLSQMDAYTNGLRETGDDNNYAYNVGWNYYSGKTSVNIGIWNVSLCMQDASGNLMNICTASNGTVTTSNRTNATTKKANTYGFKVGSPIYYSSQAYNKNTNIADTSKIFSQYGTIFDSRYSFNTTLTAGSLTAYAPIYLVGTINATDGLFYLDTTWWTQTPNDSSKIYILVGRCFDSTTSNCRIVLDQDNPWYTYDGSKLIELCNGYLPLSGGTIRGDLVVDGGINMNGYINMLGGNITNVSQINGYPMISENSANNRYNTIAYHKVVSSSNYGDYWGINYNVTTPTWNIGRYSYPIAVFDINTSTTQYNPIDASGALLVSEGIQGKIKAVTTDSQSIAINHNNIYRGEELLSSAHFGTGSTGLTALHNAVSSGDFSDIYIGDTITVTMNAISAYESTSQTVEWVVMGIDIYWGQKVRWYAFLDENNEPQPQHHLVLVPRNCFNTPQKWNTSASTTSGFRSSSIHSLLQGAYAPAINASLNSYMLTVSYTSSLSTSNTDFTYYTGSNEGRTSSSDTSPAFVTLLDEQEIYGCRYVSSFPNFDWGCDNIFLPGFRLNPNLIWKKVNGTFVKYWMKDIVSRSRVGVAGYLSTMSPEALTPTDASTYICPKICFG